MPDSFVHLHVHSEFSLLDGAIRLKSLIKNCQEKNIETIALTDNGVMYGAVEFYLQAKAEGIRPIIGCEMYIVDDHTEKKRGANRLILLCKNNAGYKNLSELVSQSHIDGFYYRPRIDFNLLKEKAEGLIAISPGYSGPIAGEIRFNRNETAKQNAEKLKSIFKDDFYIGLQKLGLPFEDPIWDESLAISKSLNIPVVATNDVYFLNQEDAPLRDILSCIQMGKTLDDYQQQTNPNHYMRSTEEMKTLFKDLPEAIDNTVTIASQCNISFDTDQVHLPKFSTPDGLSAEAYLEKLTWEGINKKYGEITEEIKDRVAFELGIINKMQYPIYFLIIHDFLAYCQDVGIPVGPGRGSAAGSIIAYALHITHIDPLKYNLLFERFLNPERVSMPDIDLDFCIKRRQEVIDYIVEKYGAPHVAQIVTFGTMQARAVVRDVGRVLDIPIQEVDRLAKMIPSTPGQYMSIPEALDLVPELKEVVSKNKTYQNLMGYCTKLEGFSRHSSTHAAGVVISKDPLASVVPLLKNDGQVTTQYSMTILEKIGLLKMDILGLRNLTVLKDAETLINRTVDTLIDIERLPENDPKTYELLCAGKTDGVFQLESSGMKQLIKDMKPNCFEDLIALLALYRPGPLGSGMVSDFVSNKSGKTDVKYSLPELEPILKDTYGMIIYQEQVMQIASTIGGFSLAQADMLRRAMGKKKKSEMDRLKKDFLDGADEKGFPKKEAEKIFELCYKFAEYGFNKSHSAAYAMISYQTAYLKANHTKEYMTALLSSVLGVSDKVTAYIHACKSLNLKVSLPNVNYSRWGFSITDDGVRYGLGAVKNIGEGAVESIILNREKEPYTSFLDFCRRVDLKLVNKRVLEGLIKCGAFDALEKDRGLLLSTYERVLAQAQSEAKSKESGQEALFSTLAQDTVATINDQADYKPLSDWEILKYEKEVTGLYLSGHPLGKMKNELDKLPYSTISFKEEDINKSVELIGLVTAATRRLTKTNREMILGTLEDLNGSMSVMIFDSENFTKHVSIFQEDAVVKLQGKVRGSLDDLTFFAHGVQSLSDHIRTQQLHIDITHTEDQDMIKSIHQTCKNNKGNAPLYLHVGSDVILAHHKYWVAETVKPHLEELVGKERVWVI